jgi:hypothetical protein
MLTIVIKGSHVEVDTDNGDGTTGATREELRVLRDVADEYCGECREVTK